MKTIILLFSIFFFPLSTFCQTWGDSSVLSKSIFYSVEESPKFESGVKGYYKFVSENLSISSTHNYSLMKNVVIVKIAISDSGDVVFAAIEKGVNEQCDLAVLMMVSKMPRWRPGRQNGRDVYCFVTLPVVLL